MVTTTTRPYCICGATMAYSGDGWDKIAADYWCAEHSGPGHAPATAAEAASARQEGEKGA